MDVSNREYFDVVLGERQLVGLLNAIQLFISCFPVLWTRTDPYISYRFLGPGLKFRYPHRRRDGHSERS